MTKEKIYPLPHSLEAEQALLGVLLINNEKILDILDLLKAEHFFFPEHQFIFEGIVKCYQTNGSADWQSVASYVEINIEDGSYLHTLAGSVLPTAKIQLYFHIIFENYQLRQIIEFGNHAIDSCYWTKGRTIPQILHELEERIFQLSMQNSNEKECFTIQEVVESCIESIQQQKFGIKQIKTGFNSLDYYRCFNKGEMCIIAARPSVGKTSFALNIASQVSTNTPVLFISLETVKENLTLKFISLSTGISSEKWIKGGLTPHDFDLLFDFAADQKQKNILIRDHPTATVYNILSAYRKYNLELMRQGKPKIGVIIVDYLQIMEDHVSSQNRTRYNVVSDISRALKGITLKNDVCLVALAQLSREIEKRADKTPIMADLKESGSIEQDADVILMLERDKKEENSPLKTHIVKNRHGKTGLVELSWDDNSQQIRDRSFYEHDYSYNKAGDK